jgi:hypothetical protein
MQNNHSGGLNWYVKADNCGWQSPCNGTTNYWSVDNPIKVPQDQWFYVEIYMHRAHDITGRFYFAVNGQTIVDQPGDSYGPNGDEVAIIMTGPQIYSNYHSGGYEWADDVQLYSTPPCSSLPCGPPS